MTIGSYIIVKNEAPWIGFHILSVLPFVDEMVFYDCGSTDGTLEIINYLQRTRPEAEAKVRLFKVADCKNLKEDYTRLFNECLGQVKSEYAWFLHPDMILTQGPNLQAFKKNPLSASVEMRHFAGEPGKKLLEFTKGRTALWPSIMRNALGLHYFGAYGVWNEGMYFRAITGDDHDLSNDLKDYPYEIVDSGIRLNHYSDVRPYERRLGRMKECLRNQKHSEEVVEKMATAHPRVSLESGNWDVYGYRLQPAFDHPPVFGQHGLEFSMVLGRPVEEICPIPWDEVSNAGFAKSQLRGFVPQEAAHHKEVSEVAVHAVDQGSN